MLHSLQILNKKQMILSEQDKELLSSLHEDSSLPDGITQASIWGN